jgi:ABC-type branched-subunit amino acid transport system ATPase component
VEVCGSRHRWSIAITETIVSIIGALFSFVPFSWRTEFVSFPARQTLHGTEENARASEVFHSPRAVREAAITRVAVQLGQLEQVLISGAAAAGPELLLLDEPRTPAVVR